MSQFRILMPIDFSDACVKAFEAAGELARIFYGIVTPMHIMLERPEFPAGYPFPLKPELAIDYDHLGKVLQRKLNQIALREMERKYLCPPLVKTGSAPGMIIDEAKNHDIIVMSSHGRSGFQRYVLGSVAEEVLQNADIPVVIVKRKSDLIPVKKILVCTDFSENSKAAFRWAKAIAVPLNANIELVNVISLEKGDDIRIRPGEPDPESVANSESKIRKLAEEHFKSLKIRTKVLTSPISAFEALIELIDTQLYNLVMMATTGHSDLDYSIMGSTTANVVRFSEQTVMVVHPKNRIHRPKNHG